VSRSRLFRTTLMVGGFLGLVYGWFAYTHQSSGALLGPVLLNVKDKETVIIPFWITIALLTAGGTHLALRQKE
jgi:hypothetical protein